MNPSPVTAVVFDLGAVLVDWNPEYLYSKLISDPAERTMFLDEICTLEWNYAMDAGLSVRDEVAKLAEERPVRRPHQRLVGSMARDAWRRDPRDASGC